MRPWLFLTLLGLASASACQPQTLHTAPTMDSTTANPTAVPNALQADDLETTRIGKIRWYTDYDAAAELARTLDKPMWVHFGEDPG
jgi:uncharacterized protein YbjT (DUF2867 family)